MSCGNRQNASVARRRMLRYSLLSAASLLCLAVPQGPLSAQTYEEAPTAPPTNPAPPDSVDAGAVKVPPKSPPYLLSTYRSNLYAPLPAKIWKQGGIPKVINQSEQFKNPHGKVGNYNVPGVTITANNAFFQSLGQNGRSCVTCHNPPSGMGLALTNIKKRFRSNLNDPLFAPVDGANCPDAVPAQYTSGSLYGGNKGKGKKALKEAYSLLLTRGLIRIPIKVPANAQYTVEVISDRAGLQHQRHLRPGSGDRREDPVHVSAARSCPRTCASRSPTRRHIRDDPADERHVGWARTQPAHAGVSMRRLAMRRRSIRRPRPKSTRSSTSRPSSSARRSSTSRRAGWTPMGFGGPVHLSTGPRAARPISRHRRRSTNTTTGPISRATRQPTRRRRSSAGRPSSSTRPLTVGNVGGFNDAHRPEPRSAAGLPGQLPDLPRLPARRQRRRAPAAARHGRRRSGHGHELQRTAGGRKMSALARRPPTICRSSSLPASTALPIRSTGRRSSPTIPARG